jgi:hypothetical protein
MMGGVWLVWFITMSITEKEIKKAQERSWAFVFLPATAPQ